MAKSYYIQIETIDRFRSAIETLSEGKTLAQISRELGHSDSYINCVLHNRKIRVSSMKQLATYLGITEEKMLGYMRDEKEPEPEPAEERWPLMDVIVKIHQTQLAILAELQRIGGERE